MSGPAGSSDKGAARWIVCGRVQGVGFRWFTLRAASQIGVVGWVRNLPDGTVEVVAGGRGEALEHFEVALRRGPSFGRVDRVDRSDVSLEDIDADSFEIR